MTQEIDSGSLPQVTPGMPDTGSTTRGARRRRLLWGGVAAIVVIVIAVTVGLVVANRSPQPVAVVQHPDPTPSPPAPWLSGVSGDDGTFDDFARWRGRPVEIAGTWSDNDQAMVELAELRSGAQFGSWDLPLDIAIGAFDDGGSWQDAADGEYDARWRRSLTNLRALRADKPGTTYIRFAHEMNGDWYPWSVTPDDKDAFIEAWQRFRALQTQIFPEAKLVFCPNRESTGGLDWREIFPGAQYVDVMGVDFYNHHPYVETAEEWQATLDETDDFGGPKGLNAHLEFAASVGLPLAVAEWSGDANFGDSPAFIQGMYDFFTEHGGTGPGEVLYEIQFNVDINDHQFDLFNSQIRLPESAEKYQELW